MVSFSKRPTKSSIVDSDTPEKTEFRRNAPRTTSPTKFPASAPAHIINPLSERSKNWDLIIMIVLVYTAIVTPFEVAFLKRQPILSVLFMLNRLVDLVFIVDMIKHFLMAYFCKRRKKWVFDLEEIALHYLKGLFILDLISIIPFDSMGTFMESDSFSRLKILRVVRLFRLFKLLRIFRATAIIARFEDATGMNFSVIKLFKFAILLGVVAHWMAALFRLVPDLEEGPTNWMTFYGLEEDASPLTVYITAFYWSVMTTTTIGYGDVVPVTSMERVVATICMAVGGSTYAYTVGAVCGVLSSIDEASAAYRQRMDELNMFVEENNCSTDLKARLRGYFRHCRVLQRQEHFGALFRAMSPALQGEVAHMNHGDWISRVPFLVPPSAPAQERVAFVTALALELSPRVFTPQEEIVREGEMSDYMYIISHGMCLLSEPTRHFSQMLTSGAFLGEDIILETRRAYSARAVSMIDVQVLSRESLMSVLSRGRFGVTQKSIRRAAIRIALRTRFPALAHSLHMLLYGKERQQHQSSLQSQTHAQHTDATAVVAVPDTIPPPNVLMLKTRGTQDSTPPLSLATTCESNYDGDALPGQIPSQGSKSHRSVGLVGTSKLPLKSGDGLRGGELATTTTTKTPTGTPVGNTAPSGGGGGGGGGDGGGGGVRSVRGVLSHPRAPQPMQQQYELIRVSTDIRELKLGQRKLIDAVDAMRQEVRRLHQRADESSGRLSSRRISRSLSNVGRVAIDGVSGQKRGKSSSSSSGSSPSLATVAVALGVINLALLIVLVSRGSN